MQGVRCLLLYTLFLPFENEPDFKAFESNNYALLNDTDCSEH